MMCIVRCHQQCSVNSRGAVVLNANVRLTRSVVCVARRCCSELPCSCRARHQAFVCLALLIVSIGYVKVCRISNKDLNL